MFLSWEVFFFFLTIMKISRLKCKAFLLCIHFKVLGFPVCLIISRDSFIKCCKHMLVSNSQAIHRNKVVDFCNIYNIKKLMSEFNHLYVWNYREKKKRFVFSFCFSSPNCSFPINNSRPLCISHTVTHYTTFISGWKRKKDTLPQGSFGEGRHSVPYW